MEADFCIGANAPAGCSYQQCCPQTWIAYPFRTQNGWQAVEEITAKLQEFDPEDPVKYDFALFGLGVFEKF